ncbi:urea transporter [Castellaniella caeni]
MIKPLSFVALSRQCLRGIGQIYLQRSAWAGACFLLAVVLQAPTLGLACALGALVGTLWGRRCGMVADCEDGLHGYNGALAGIAVLVVLPPGVLAWGLVVLAAGLSTWLAQIWRRTLPLSPYTGPFVLVTWLLMAVAAVMQWPQAAAANSGGTPLAETALVLGTLRGLGQVMFLDQPGAGLLCLLGLALSDRRAGAYGLLSSGGAALFAWGMGLPLDALALGLYGFNAVLVAEALRQALPGRWLVLFGAVLVSVLLTRGFQWLALPSLTAPFVLVTLLARMLTQPASAHLRSGDC